MKFIISFILLFFYIISASKKQNGIKIEIGIPQENITDALINNSGENNEKIYSFQNLSRKSSIMITQPIKIQKFNIQLNRNFFANTTIFINPIFNLAQNLKVDIIKRIKKINYTLCKIFFFFFCIRNEL